MRGVGSVLCGVGIPQPTTTTLLILLIAGCLTYTIADSGRSERFPRSTNCSHRRPAKPAYETKVKVVVKPIPKPAGKGSGDHPAANEITGKENVHVDTQGYIPDSETENDPLPPCHDPGPDIRVTTTADSDKWKTNVIIGCTVAAAIEIIIIIVIIAYWREIRWTMRKIPCPCDERPSRHGEHEAMERADAGVVRVAAPEQRDLIGHTEDYGEDIEVDGPMQTFRHPSRSRTQEALDDITDDTTPV